MTTEGHDAGIPPLWGRQKELDRICARIFDQARSVTLVTGESGIGKTALLSNVAQRLSERPNVVVGLHSTVPGQDPLLNCLDDLLGNLRGASRREEFVTLIHYMKREISASQITKMLLAIIKYASKDLGELLEALTKGLSQLDLKPGIPQLDIHTFRKMVHAIRDALPGHKLVFIIDNLSACVDPQSGDSRGRLGLSTLESFLSQNFDSAGSLHFVLSWQITPDNLPQSDALKGVVRAASGTVLQLGPLENHSQIEKWLESVMPWYGSIGKPQREVLLDKSKGLPLIITRWAELGLEYFDEAILSDEAHDVLEGKYFLLQNRIQSATNGEKKLLYAIGLSNRPLSVLALALLCDQPMETVEQLASAWVAQTILRRVPPTTSAPFTFTFDHEAKRSVALEVLFQTTSERNRIQKQFLTIAISHCNTGLPELNHFIDLALLLCRETNLAAPSSVIRMLEDLLQMIANVEIDRKSQLDSDVLGMLSPSIGIAYLSMLLHCKRPQKSEVVDAFRVLLNDHRCGTAKTALEIVSHARCIVHIIQHCDDWDHECVVQSVRNIEGVCKCMEHDERVAAILAATLAAASSVASEKNSRWGVLSPEAIEWEGRMRTLRRSFPLNGEIVDSFALALMWKMLRLRRSGTDMDLSTEEITELCALSDEYPERAYLAKIVAYSIRRFIRTGRELVPNEEVVNLVGVQQKLIGRFPESEHIAESFARVGPFALHALRQDREKASEMWECACEIQRRFPENESIREAVAQAGAIFASSSVFVGPAYNSTDGGSQDL